MSEQDLLEIMYDWWRGWGTMDKSYIEKVLPSNNHITLIGTADSEYLLDKEMVINTFTELMQGRREKGWKPAKEIDISRFKMITSYIKDNFSYLIIEEENEFFGDTGNIRYTCNLELIDGTWKLIHLHCSVPDPKFTPFSENVDTVQMQKTLEGWIRKFDFMPNLNDDLKVSKLKSYLTEASNLLLEISSDT